MSQEIPTDIYNRFDDGYLVRRMTLQDAEIAIGWYSTLADGHIGHDLRACVRILPSGPGLYVGELHGEVVASLLQIDWGNGICYGSYYYVAEQHRGKGYGTRLRDQVARDHLGGNSLTIDAVMSEKLLRDNHLKHGYVYGLKTSRWKGTVPILPEMNYKGTLCKATDITLDELVSYDDQHFVSAGSKVRRDFLAQLIAAPGGAAFVVKDSQGHVTAFGCRRPCEESGCHLLGPLYANSSAEAEVVFRELCRDITGSVLILAGWAQKAESNAFIEKYGLSEEMVLQRMYLNRDPAEFKDTVYAFTSFAVCGF